jgi:two-component system, chemotaxis family, chemotaxis protein CheY
MVAATKPRVLIADDEPHVRVLLRAILKSMNCEVVGEAANGVETVELFKTLKPHLLLLDINMPLKTGYEVLEEILADFPSALVIMLTSVTDLESVEKCIELGAANYIRKDTPTAELKSIIKETFAEFVRSKSKPASA